MVYHSDNCHFIADGIYDGTRSDQTRSLKKILCMSM